MTEPENARNRLVWLAAGVLWLAAVGVGLAVVARYGNTAGAAASAPDQWPATSRIARDTARPTLVMMAHPLCTCTRASLAELGEIMARAAHRPRAYVVFISPERFSGGDLRDLWERAARIPGVTIVRDEKGIEARTFGAWTSGQVFLYDRHGRLIFSGGATGSRGHEGDNAGRAAILALLSDAPPDLTGTSVFGCSLFASTEEVEADESTHHDHHHN